MAFTTVLLATTSRQPRMGHCARGRVGGAAHGRSAANSRKQRHARQGLGGRGRRGAAAGRAAAAGRPGRLRERARPADIGMGAGRGGARAADALLAVAYGFGIVIYFTADRERAWWAAVALALACAAVAILARRRPLGFPLALGFAGIAPALPPRRCARQVVAHPVLQHAAATVTLTGFLEIREERERSDRITVRVQHIDSPRRLTKAPDRMRPAVRKDTAPPVGSFIELKANLSPPLTPLRPAATTSRATCISGASAPPVMSWARSKLYGRRSAGTFGCNTPW